MNKDQCLALFLLAGFSVTHAEQLPNNYWPDVPDYAELRKSSPWWYVKTQHGFVKIGWRKRVISIEWMDTRCRQWITTDDVTKDLTMVHAWSYVKALEYLTILRQRLDGIHAIDEGGDLMTVKDFIDACNANAFTDDDGIGWMTTTLEPMNGFRTDVVTRPSKAAGKLPTDFHPFTHVVWINR